jgi:hypothetical protein
MYVPAPEEREGLMYDAAEGKTEREKRKRKK